MLASKACFRLVLLFSLSLTLASASHADAPLAVPVSGAPFQGELMACDAQWLLTFRLPHLQRAVSTADLVYWGEPTEQGRAEGLVLADGSLLVANVVAADKKGVSAVSLTFGTLHLPRSAVAGVVFRWPSNRPDRDKLYDAIALSPFPLGERQLNTISPLPLGEGQGVRAAMDRLLLDNGDELTGSLLSIADGTVTFQTDVGPVPIKADRINAIIFNSARNRQEPAALRAWLGFRDGSRLLATQLLIAGQSLTLTAAGQKLTTAPSSVVFLQPLGGHTVYLSDLAPTEYRQTPYLDLQWPYRNDRNVTGELLRCGKRLFLKGLGVHSAARLVYDIGAGQGGRNISPLPLGEGQGVRAVGFKRFEADLGIDDSTAGQGSVQFRVLVDGQEKYRSPIVRGGNPSLPISVDVTGGKKLELIVDYADRADVQDHADWLNARLIE